MFFLIIGIITGAILICMVLALIIFFSVKSTLFPTEEKAEGYNGYFDFLAKG